MNYPKYNLPSFTSGYRHEPSEFLLTLTQMQPQQEEVLTMGGMKDAQNHNFFKIWFLGLKKPKKPTKTKNHKTQNKTKSRQGNKVALYEKFHQCHKAGGQMSSVGASLGQCLSFAAALLPQAATVRDSLRSPPPHISIAKG